MPHPFIHNIMKYIAIPLFVLCLSSETKGQVAPLWINNIHDTLVAAYSLDLVVEENGENYTLAYYADTSFPWPSGNYNLLVKYDASGSLLWLDTFHLTPSPFDCKMGLGEDGCVYLTGRYVTAPYAGQVMVMRISPAGNILWRNHYAAPSTVGEVGGISFDDSMNVYVTGTSVNLDQAVMMKCDSSGNLRWITSYNNITNLYDRGNAVVADNSGNSYFAISSMAADTTYDFVVVKYSPVGQFLWERRFDSLPDQGPLFIRIFHDTDIVVCGTSNDLLGNTNILTMQYDYNGNLEWWTEFDTYVLYAPNGGADAPKDMIVTRSGKVAITGKCNDHGMAEWLNLLYDQNGNLLWIRRDYDICSPRSAAEDNNGNLVFASDASDTAAGLGGIGVSKYDTLGNLLWRNIYSASPLSGPSAASMALDSFGNIYCAGMSYGTPEKYIVTLRYDFTAKVEEQVEDVDVNVYPNPVTDHVVFTLGEGTGLNTIILYDQIGREVMCVSSNQNRIEIFVGDLASGMYFYRVVENGFVRSSGKFLIQQVN